MISNRQNHNKIIGSYPINKATKIKSEEPWLLWKNNPGKKFKRKKNKTKSLDWECASSWTRLNWGEGVKCVPRAIRRRPQYKSAAWHPIPSIGLRGEDGWNRGDRVRAAVAEGSVFSDEIETDELFVNIDDVDDEDRFVSGASAYPLPIKPFRLIGVANLKPFCCTSRGCGIFRNFGESSDKSEPANFFISILQNKKYFRMKMLSRFTYWWEN